MRPGVAHQQEPRPSRRALQEVGHRSTRRIRAPEIRVNQTWSISVPWRSCAPGGDYGRRQWLLAALIALDAQARCECQRTIGPAGRSGRAAPRRMLHIAPTSTSGASRGVREDEGLRPAGIEGESPAPLLRVLRVEVVNQPVARLAGPRSAHLCRLALRTMSRQPPLLRCRAGCARMAAARPITPSGLRGRWPGTAAC